MISTSTSGLVLFMHQETVKVLVSLTNVERVALANNSSLHVVYVWVIAPVS